MITRPENFLVLAFTAPVKINCEVDKIVSLLENNDADFVHLRKPEMSLNETKKFLKDIPEIFHKRIKLHDHFELTEEFDLGGIHLNKRNPHINGVPKTVSKSLHHIEELDNIDNYCYVTLSPIFDSISKSGYTSKFNLSEIKNLINGKKVIALGGVTPEKIPMLADNCFYGAAMLGYFWK